jgi:anti-sigma regulatory factor (Ser/Thr protein kinase)
MCAKPVIKLPRYLEGSRLSELAPQIEAAAGGRIPDQLSIDFSGLEFIKPCGVVFLSNLVHWLAIKSCKVVFVECSTRTQPISYLDDSLFFEQHLGRKLNEAASPRSTTRPLIKIAQPESHAWLDTNLVPWLAARLGITRASVGPFRASISELFNNIKDHTKLDIGSIFVQHFPRIDRIEIAVSDFGQGIPASIRAKLPDLTDGQAIRKAVEEGFTTQSLPTNRGAGLDYLLRVVVLGNGGSVTIYSGRGIVRFDRSGDHIAAHELPGVGFCPGTTIEIHLRTDTIEVLPSEEEELEW